MQQPRHRLAPGCGLAHQAHPVQVEQGVDLVGGGSSLQG